MNERVADRVSELRTTLMQIKCSSLHVSTYFEYVTDVLRARVATDVSKLDCWILLRTTGVSERPGKSDAPLTSVLSVSSQL